MLYFCHIKIITIIHNNKHKNFIAMKRYFSMVLMMALFLSTFQACNHKPVDQKNTNLSTEGVVVEASAELMEVYDEDINYLKRKKNTDEAVQSLENIKQLFMDNNYVLDTPELVEEYNLNVKRFSDCIEEQPFFVRNRF